MTATTLPLYWLRVACLPPGRVMARSSGVRGMTADGRVGAVKANAARVAGTKRRSGAIEEQAPTSVPDFIHRFNPPFPVGYSGLKPSMDFMQHPPKLTPHMPLIAFIGCSP